MIIWDPWQQLGPGHSLCLLATAYLAAARLQGRQGQANLLLSSLGRLDYAIVPFSLPTHALGATTTGTTMPTWGCRGGAAM